MKISAVSSVQYLSVWCGGSGVGPWGASILALRIAPTVLQVRRTQTLLLYTQRHTGLGRFLTFLTPPRSVYQLQAIKHHSNTFDSLHSSSEMMVSTYRCHGVVIVVWVSVSSILLRLVLLVPLIVILLLLLLLLGRICYWGLELTSLYQNNTYN